MPRASFAHKELQQFGMTVENGESGVATRHFPNRISKWDDMSGHVAAMGYREAPPMTRCGTADAPADSAVWGGITGTGI